MLITVSGTLHILFLILTPVLLGRCFYSYLIDEEPKAPNLSCIVQG